MPVLVTQIMLLFTLPPEREVLVTSAVTKLLLQDSTASTFKSYVAAYFEMQQRLLTLWDIPEDIEAPNAVDTSQNLSQKVKSLDIFEDKKVVYRDLDEVFNFRKSQMANLNQAMQTYKDLIKEYIITVEPTMFDITLYR